MSAVQDRNLLRGVFAFYGKENFVEDVDGRQKRCYFAPGELVRNTQILPMIRALNVEHKGSDISRLLQQARVELKFREGAEEADGISFGDFARIIACSSPENGESTLREIFAYYGKEKLVETTTAAQYNDGKNVVGKKAFWGPGELARAVQIVPMLRALSVHVQRSDIRGLLSELQSELKVRENCNTPDAINFDDFRAIYSMRSMQVQSKILKEALFNAVRTFDKTGNGFVSGSELRHMMSSFGERIPSKIVESFLDLADEDANTQFEYGVFINKLEI